MKKLYLALFLALLSANCLLSQNFEVDGITYNITSVEAPYTVEVIGTTSKFIDFVSIPEQVIYNGISHLVTSIGFAAFFECFNLSFVSIPKSVTNIGSMAFQMCFNLGNIMIPYSIMNIDQGAFFNCTGLESIDVDARNMQYSSVNGVLYDKEKTKLIQYPISKVGGSFSIPISVTHIDYGAFEYCSNLTSIEIPNSVSFIGERAFGYCVNLTSINVSSGNENYSSADGVLYSKEKTKLIQYPEGKDGNSFIIPNSVTSIGNSAFYNCSGLTAIEIPNSVTNIGYSAFYNCRGLVSIEIPNSVTNIESEAFHYCMGLTSIAIPNSVIHLGFNVFLDCTGLRSIDVDSENNFFTSDNGVLYNKEKTELIKYPISKEDLSFNIPNSVTSIRGSAFFRCLSLISIEISGSVNDLGSNAFAGCRSLTSITCYSEYPPVLGGSVFYNVPKAIPLYVPASSFALYQQALQWKDFNIVGITVEETFEVDDIGYKITSAEAHYSVEITSKMLGYEGDVVIPEYVIYEGKGYSVTSIGERAFSGSNGLKSIENPQIVLKNGHVVNELSTGLTSIEIPQSVSNIGDGAFEDCSSLLSITCHADTPPILGIDVFKNVPKDIPLFVPANSVALYQQALQWKDFNIIALVTTSDFNAKEIHCHIAIYPNPANDVLNVGIQGYDGELMFEIFNTTGQCVLSGIIDPTKTINTSVLEPGVYVIRMNGNNWAGAKRFIKK